MAGPIKGGDYFRGEADAPGRNVLLEAAQVDDMQPPGAEGGEVCFHGQMSAAIQLMLEAGAAAGALRDDVRAEDVVASVVGTFLACGQPEQRDQARWMLDLLMHALRRPAL